MQATIKIYTKNVYGQTMIYMVEDEKSDTIKSLIGKKTIDKNDIRLLQNLGVNFEQVVENSVL